MNSLRARAALSVCLLLSGAAALIYEVLWARQLALVMGQTVYALSAVISTFLAGLALGAWLAARWLRHRRASLLLYAVLELGIAVSAALVPRMIAALDGPMGIAYRQWGERLLVYSGAQLVLCAPVLLLPTILMGATLPLAAALFVRGHREVSGGVGWLYGVNTLGGVIGCSLCGFVLMPQIGMLRTSSVAVGLNVAAAALALGMWLDVRRGSWAARAVCEPEGEVQAAGKPVRAWLFAAIYGLSGFASLALEVGWARLVGLSIGSTTYGFTIILSTYIAGIGIGSLVLSRLPWLRGEPVGGLFALHGLIAVGSVGALGFLGDLPQYVFRVVTDPASGMAGTLAREAAVVFASIAVPTLAMGAAYPLVTALLSRLTGNVGTASGLAYAANTAGNIAGSLFAGFVLIPWIGMRWTIIFAAALSALAGVLFLSGDRNLRLPSFAARAAVLAVVLLAVTLSAPQWHLGLITSAPYAAGKVEGQSPEQRGPMLSALVDYREGASTVITVTREFGGALILRQDGLAEAGSHGDFHRLLGHLPLLLHDDPTKVLLVGLGAGHTLDAILTHPVDTVECVEISAELVDAARRYFHPAALEDSRVRLRIGDGRNHLRHTHQVYDVIISQPSQAWLSGAASLFTRESYAEMSRRLAPGGLAVSWFASYTADSRLSIIKAFAEVFPHVFLFDVQGLPTVLVGSRTRERLSPVIVRQRMRSPRVGPDLAALGYADEAEVLATLVAGRDQLSRIDAKVPVNSDDNGYVAFHGVGQGFIEPVDHLKTLREDPRPYLDLQAMSASEATPFVERLEQIRRLRQEALDPQKLIPGRRLGESR